MSSLSLLIIWLDQRIGSLPGENETLKEKFRKVLSLIDQFDKPTLCLDFLQDSMKDKRVLFLTSGVFAEEDFLRHVVLLPNILYIYIYGQENRNQYTDDKILSAKMSLQRVDFFYARLYDRTRPKKEAKHFYEYAVELLQTIDDRDQELQKDLLSRIDRIN